VSPQTMRSKELTCKGLVLVVNLKRMDILTKALTR
jgi:hypothetical protein